MVRQLEQRARDPASERKKAPGCDESVCLTQASSKKPDQRFVDLGVFFRKGLERSAAQKAHYGFAHRHHGCRTRQPINNRKLADDSAPAEEGKDAFAARLRNDYNLEESVLDAIAAAAWLPGPEQDLTRPESHQFGARKQLCRNIGRQPRQQTWIFRLEVHSAP